MLGTNDDERRQLAALGGVASALVEAAGARIEFSRYPMAVQNWFRTTERPSPHVVDQLINDMRADFDPLALVYERIVSSHRRRRLGTFFTPRPVLDYMRSAVANLRLAPVVIADPGAGVGAFTVAARRWWPNAVVHAIDINVVTLGLLAARLAVDASANADAGALRVRHDDFLEWLSSTWHELPAPRLILGNPPYTRHQQLSASDKQSARVAGGNLAPGGRAGLSTYFLAASLLALDRSDSLCLLLPANWLEADYARPVRRRLWEQSRRRVDLHLFPNELNVFPDAQVAAMVLIVGPERSSLQEFRLFGVDSGVAGKFTRSLKAVVDRKDGLPASFTPGKLVRARSVDQPTNTVSVPLGSLVTVRRGVATGANNFFLRTLDDVKRLPSRSCVRAVSRLRALEGDVLNRTAHDRLGKSGEKCWILDLDVHKAEHPDIQELLRTAEVDGLHERYLCAQRTPWYSLESIAAPDILVGPMGKERFRIVVNEIGAIPTNTLYGIRMRVRAKPTVLRVKVDHLANWLASAEGQDALRSDARKHHGDGLLKIEPGALSQIRIPADVAAQLES